MAIIGDIAHSRVARSNVYLLSKYGADIVLCGPASLLPMELKQLAPGVTLTTDMDEAIRDADVIMMLRVQLERQHEASFPASEYFRFYGLRLEHLDLAKPDDGGIPARSIAAARSRPGLRFAALAVLPISGGTGYRCAWQSRTVLGGDANAGAAH